MSVIAVYRNRVYLVGDNLDECHLVDGPTVNFGDADLIIDPTDKQIADVENLGDFYEMEGAALERFRGELRGD